MQLVYGKYAIIQITCTSVVHMKRIHILQSLDEMEVKKWKRMT